ncbi:AfsR/SARP family transcriptional regulator [Streptomyces bambusae]|uniref:AfsR/SARP family transcriptional regulator n=1 Tax=Streptomyces bambusae TaxID=1550616 RepID=UPI001CFCDC7C|nr:AfsR/SARP family transcriptional regulator [Streptomyces bambusae]MCB5168275.1 AfsR/SARP family transcriptional regulator [Streptomyces bambusae]
MQFRILGLVEVQDERTGLRILPTGAKQRALLGALVVKAGQHVSVPRLIDELWGEHPPANADNALQVHVARLRRLLAGAEPAGEGPEPAKPHPWITTTSHGYSLRPATVETDAARFQALAEEARRVLPRDPEHAGELLRRGLSLWRGAALEGSVLGDICGGRAAQLEELRLTALEMLYDAYLRTGRHGEIIGELVELTCDHPVRERFYDLLMVAFYRSGRQAEALGVYERARTRMVRDLGVEPGPALRGLMEAVLHHDPSLTPRPLPVSPLPLADEMARLHRRIEVLQQEQSRLLARFEQLTAAGEGRVAAGSSAV